MTCPNPTKALSQPVIVKLNLLMVLLQNNEICMNIIYFNKSHNKNMHKHWFINFALYFVLEKCVYYTHA